MARKLKRKRKVTDWMPRGQEKAINFAKMWITVFGEETKDSSGKTVKKWVLWGITEALYTAFIKAWDKAQSAFQAANNRETRTTVTIAASAAASKELIAIMREIKRRHFFPSPMTEADFASVGIKYPDRTYSRVGAPSGLVGAVVSNPRLHVVGLDFLDWDDSPDNNTAAGISYRYGVYPPGGASAEQIAADSRLLAFLPTHALQLSEQKWTGRNYVEVIFRPEDAGKKAYFCCRYENNKGDAGEWGPIIEAVIT